MKVMVNLFIYGHFQNEDEFGNDLFVGVVPMKANAITRNEMNFGNVEIMFHSLCGTLQFVLLKNGEGGGNCDVEGSSHSGVSFC